MTALAGFADFVATTGSSILTGPDDLVNECVKNTYVLRRFLKGADKSFVIQGGKSITDTLMLDYTATWQQYQPNDTFTYSNPQSLTSWNADWKFTADHMSWTDQEIELQNPKSMSESALRGYFKNLKRSKEMRLWTSLLNGMEEMLWRLPSAAEMEYSSTNPGAYPYSIPAFVNELSSGLYTTAAGAPATWTVVEGVSPTTYTRWVPQQQVYNTQSVSTTGADDSGTATGGINGTDGVNIIQAFDKMFYLTKFESPPTRQEYFESSAYQQVIFTSRKGITAYQTLLRNSQDRFTGIGGYQDPAYTSPTFAGIDLQYVAQLDTATLYASGSSTAVAESTADIKGPRYYWINGKYLCPVFHSSRYMTKHAPIRPSNQPFSTFVLVDSWWNLVCRSRQRHGIVYPAADMYYP